MPGNSINPVQQGETVMPTQDLEKLLKDVATSIKATRNSLAALDRMLNDGPPPSQTFIINSKMATARAELIHFNMIEAHLDAAGAEVSPLSAEESARLDELAGFLDRAILSDFIFNATLAMVRGALAAAEEIGDIAGD